MSVGKHRAKELSQEECILQRVTDDVERQFSDHPRRYGKLKPGLVVHYQSDDLGRDFTGTVVNADPLHIDWKY